MSRGSLLGRSAICRADSCRQQYTSRGLETLSNGDGNGDSDDDDDDDDY